MRFIVLLLTLVSFTVNAENISPDETTLFGVKIVDATRAQIREALDAKDIPYWEAGAYSKANELRVDSRLTLPGTKELRLSFWNDYLVSAVYVFGSHARPYNGTRWLLSTDMVAQELSVLYGYPEQGPWVYSQNEPDQEYRFTGKDVEITVHMPEWKQVELLYEVLPRKLAMKKDQPIEERKEAVARAKARSKLYSASNSDDRMIEVRKYMQNVLNEHWKKPRTAENDMRAEVAIHVLPDGSIDEFYITDSSGDPAFDRAAWLSVRRTGKFEELAKEDVTLFSKELSPILMTFRIDGVR